MRDERTTKVVTGTFRVVFHGGYVPVDEVFAQLEQWVDAGLEDRDDLRNWSFDLTHVEEIHGDPEGFDA